MAGETTLDERAQKALRRVRMRDREETVAAICAAHHCTTAQLYGRSRVHDLVAARRALIVAFFGQTGSLSETARLTGLDHSTVFYHLRIAREATAATAQTVAA